MLALRSQLDAPPQAASQLRHRIWAQRRRWPRREVLRGVRSRRRRSGESQAWHAPPRRDSGPAVMDRVQARHGDHAQAGADHEQLQDHRRTRRQRSHS